MNKCDNYCEDIRKVPRYSQYNGSYIGSVIEKYGYCNGTRERDECSCCGNRAKCDFYPEVREKSELPSYEELYDFWIKTKQND